MKIDFKPAEIFRGTQIYRQANDFAYAYQTTHMAVDADGAPNAYNPDNTGLDSLINAGYPHTNWWKDVLVPDPADSTKAFVQPSGPYAGFFVSMTALRSPTGKVTDPATYVDATEFPYVVIPTGFGLNIKASIARPGDVGFATHLESGKTTTFIVGDAGGGINARLGEASIALFVSLGETDPNPRTGAGVPGGTIQYIIFPGSRQPKADIWPRTNQDIHNQAMALIAKTPGIG